MQTNRKILGAAAFSLALAGGGVADLVEHITAMVNGERPEGFGSHGPPAAA